MTSNDCHASPAGLEVCLRCKKGVKGNEAGFECDRCHYSLHTKCEGVDLYKALQKFEEAVRVGRSNSAIKWYCDSCAITVEKVNGRLQQLEMGQVISRLMDEMAKFKKKMDQEMKELKEELGYIQIGCVAIFSLRIIACDLRMRRKNKCNTRYSVGPFRLHA